MYRPTTNCFPSDSVPILGLFTWEVNECHGGYSNMQFIVFGMICIYRSTYERRTQLIALSSTRILRVPVHYD